jgi:hypothetical protein
LQRNSLNTASAEALRRAKMSQFDRDVDFLKNVWRRQRDIDAFREQIRRNAVFEKIHADEQQANAQGERMLLAIYALAAIVLWWLS